MGRRSLAVTLGIVGIIVVVVLAVVLGHKNSNGSLSASQVSAAKQQIRANWKTFFAYATPLSERERLLQNSSQFAQTIESEFKALGSQKSSAIVNEVKLNSNSQAEVTYTVDLNGQAVLPNQAGQAVLDGGTWKVSASTFCQLLGMAGSKPAACQNVQ